jgi:hypothetical protein
MSKHILVCYIDRFDYDETSSHTHAVRGEVLNRLKVTVAEIRSRDRSRSRL